MPKITYQRLVELFEYDPSTGLFKRLIKVNRANIGDIPNSIDSRGYCKIKIDGNTYYAHRLVWLYMTGKYPTKQIDHINRIKHDNRFVNLREATASQNQMNRPAKKTNTTKLKGVSKNGNKFTAKITKNRKRIYLGCFDTAEEAHKAYCIKAKKLFGDFAI